MKKALKIILISCGFIGLLTTFFIWNIPFFTIYASPIPHAQGADLLIRLKTEDGISLDKGAIFIAYRYDPPYDVFDVAFPDIAYNGVLFPIEPPPENYPMTIEVRGSSPNSGFYKATNKEYWEAVAGSGRDYVAEVEFTIKSEAGAPVVFSIDVSSPSLTTGVEFKAKSVFFANRKDEGSFVASWDWGDGQTSSSTLTTKDGHASVEDVHTYKKPGNYNLSLTVTDKDGRSGNFTLNNVKVEGESIVEDNQKIADEIKEKKVDIAAIRPFISASALLLVIILATVVIYYKFRNRK